MAYANLSTLTQRKIGQKIKLEKGVPQELAEYYALGGDSVNDLGYLFDLTWSFSNAAHINTITVQLNEGRATNGSAASAPTEEHELSVVVTDCDVYDTTSNVPVRYTLAATSACDTVDATKAAGYLRRKSPFCPSLLLKSNNGAGGGGYGKFVFTVSRFGVDGTTARVSTGSDCFVDILLFSPQVHPATTYTKRIRLTDFNT